MISPFFFAEYSIIQSSDYCKEVSGGLALPEASTNDLNVLGFADKTQEKCKIITHGVVKDL